MNSADSIRVYVAEVRNVAAQLRLALGAQDLIAAVLSGKIARRGTVGNLKYEFHGYGCRVVDAGQTLDFEFGAGGEAGGFDAWRIWLYVRERGQNEFASLQVVEHQIAAMATQGTIARRADDPMSPLLYYFK